MLEKSKVLRTLEQKVKSEPFRKKSENSFEKK